MLDYYKLAEKYKPKKITKLIVGEAPPPSGKKYFYHPIDLKNNRNIEDDATLPATIFNHCFGKRPNTKLEYEKFLTTLKDKGVFLIDIIDEPRRIRDRNEPGQRNQKNLSYLINQIPKLRNKIKNLGIEVNDQNIIFLLARQDYKKELKDEFPNCQYYRWKEFRMNVEVIWSKSKKQNEG